MESPASAAGPRVYVPIAHPDSPVPTYAVLQFLGFSPPPDPKQGPVLQTHFAPPPSPPIKLLPCTSPVSNPPSPVLRRGASPPDSSSNSSCDERDKKLTSLKPSLMKKSASTGSHGSALSPGARRNGKVLPLAATISISRTDKDTIIHTHSSNFREVVHQLTGAASGDKDLLPVSMPARSINKSMLSNDKDVSPVASPSSAMHGAVQNGGNYSQVHGKQEGLGLLTPVSMASPKLLELGSMKKPVNACTTTKLLERRKSNKVLERLSTSCRNPPPFVPSPVTPLASDFEKICLPGTPSTSEGSSTVVTPVACAPALANDTIAMEVLAAAKAKLSQESKALLLTGDAKAAEAASMDGVRNPCDAMDVQGSSLSLSTGRDMHAYPPPRIARVRLSKPRSSMDMQGPSLALATGMPEAMDVQHAVATQERSTHEAMVITEGEGLCDGDGAQGSTTGRTTTHDEESVIARKGFFFHTQMARHSDATLLHLFPESPREP